ncbi:MAG: hypothetical protein ACI8W8_000105 [Rhodothermales bacterium]|jgi:hypothetical protein
MSDVPVRRPSPPIWAIWANPLVRRYAQSRLRPAAFGLRLLIVFLLTAFVFTATRAASVRSGMDGIDLARVPLIPLLVLQWFILYAFATGQVAGGMTQEADEDVLDYQRLAPMAPMAKVLGYLFGLPIREWLLFMVPLPFTVWSLVTGEVPWQIGLQLYAVFVAGAIMHHLTGLVAGTVIRNRRFAFLGAIALVFMLYTLVPQIARFGLVFFKYITIMPVFEECYFHLIPRDAGAVAETVQRLLPSAKFFGLDLPQFAFTLMSQGVLILVMLTMLWRRWRRSDSHLLGKLGAVSLFAWIQLAFLGSALPLIDTGELFPSRELKRRFGRFMMDLPAAWSPTASEAMAMIAAYGTVTVAILWWMTSIIAASRDVQIKGWRRARKLAQPRLAILSDAASSIPAVLIMAAIGCGGWLLFIDGVLSSRWFPDYQTPANTLLVIAPVLFLSGLILSAMLEGRGARATLLAAILCCIVPVMIGTVLGIWTEFLAAPATWLIGICPAAWPTFAAGMIIPNNELSLRVTRAMPNAYIFYQGLAGFIALRLLADLVRRRRAIAQEETV